MKAVTLSKDGFLVRRLPVPAPGDDEVLLKTLACGVCEGDVFRYRSRLELKDAILLGHEGTGVIAAMGSKVRGFQLGDVVTTLEGTAPAGGGAYAEQFVARSSQIVRVPSDVDPLHALGEPVACCVHASGRFGIKKGDRVAVIGCGFMGLVCMQLARHQGAGFVAAFEPLEYRRAMAMSLGADVANDTTGRDARSFIREGERLFDLVIEAAGVPAALDLGTELVAEHGRLVIVGYHQSDGGRRTVDMRLWNYRSITVESGHVRRSAEKLEAMQKGMQLISAGSIQTELLTSLYPLERVQEAFDDFLARKPGVFKAVLVPK